MRRAAGHQGVGQASRKRQEARGTLTRAVQHVFNGASDRGALARYSELMLIGRHECHKLYREERKNGDTVVLSNEKQRATS